MYEYECLGCGSNYYSSVSYGDMNNIFCENCGDYIFYSIAELYTRFDDEKWLLKAYSDLERKLHEAMFDLKGGKK